MSCNWFSLQVRCKHGNIHQHIISPHITACAREQDPEKIGIVLTFLSVTVVGQVTPLGALSVRLVKSQGPLAGAGGAALVITREPKEQTTPFPGESSG